MREDNLQEHNPVENFAIGNAPQSLDANVATDMVVYEPQNDPNDVPPEVAAQDPPQFIPQDVPENIQVNEQFRHDQRHFQESMPQEQIYDNNVPWGNDLESQTGSRVHFDESSSSRRPREKDSRRIGSHGGDSHGGGSHRGDAHRRDHRIKDYSEKKSQHSRRSESHRSTSEKKHSHRSGSDRKDSHRSESRRPDRHQKDSEERDSHKTSKKDGSHKKKMIDATPEYGSPSFMETLACGAYDVPMVRRRVEKKPRRTFW